MWWWWCTHACGNRVLILLIKTHLLKHWNLLQYIFFSSTLKLIMNDSNEGKSDAPLRFDWVFHINRGGGWIKAHGKLTHLSHQPSEETPFFHRSMPSTWNILVRLTLILIEPYSTNRFVATHHTTQIKPIERQMYYTYF